MMNFHTTRMMYARVKRGMVNMPVEQDGHNVQKNRLWILAINMSLARIRCNGI